MGVRTSSIIVLVLLSSQVAAHAHVPASVSFGLGIPYGIAGLNGEIGGLLTATAGVGVVMDSVPSTGWCVGGRLNLLLGDRFRFRFNCLYGTAAFVEKPGPNEAWARFVYGPGLRWRSFQFDLLRVVTDVPPGYYTKGGDLKIALGFALPLTKRPAGDPGANRDAGGEFAAPKE